MLLPLVWPIRTALHLRHRLSKRNSIDAKLVRALLAGICLFILFLNTFAAILLVPGHFFGNLARLQRNESRLFLDWKKLASITLATGVVLLFVNPFGQWGMFTAVSAFYIALGFYPIACFSALACWLPALGIDLLMRGSVKLLVRVGVGRAEGVNKVGRAAEWLAPVAYSLEENPQNSQKGVNRPDRRTFRVGCFYCFTFAFVMSYPMVWLWPALTTRIPPFLVVVLFGFVACLRPYREVQVASQNVPRQVYQRDAMEDFITELCRRLSDHFKSGQRLSLQNRPTGLAVQD